jgi:hypothetical protein
MVTLSLKKLKIGDFRHFKFLFLSQCHLLAIFHPKKRTIWNLRARYCTFEISPVILETIFVGPAFQGQGYYVDNHYRV